MVQIKQVKIPTADALGLRDVLEIYQALRPSMPAGRMGKARPALRLIDLLDEFPPAFVDGGEILQAQQRLAAVGCWPSLASPLSCGGSW